jgi:mono/diheme cytochrome c family protein
MRRTLSFPLAVLFAFSLLNLANAADVPPVDYNRQVRQILSNHCYACHGPDKAQLQAGLRLDQREAALAELESGGHAIVPGDSAASKLIARITSTDAAEVMPPADSTKPLSAEQIEILKRWVSEGAKWDEHWSYQPIARPAAPSVANTAWPRTPIDYFVLQRLEQEQLAPEPEADRATLIRRLSFDLTGLPPSVADVDAFVADQRPDAYERLVDRLLSSPRYGERMAQKWLDLARYADTNGYHIDNHRDIWLYRNWVIDAFNRNVPFDQFTIEQFAGDLLPNPTTQQRIATGFHRNAMVNFEGGADPAEYLSKYIVDRVTTTATVFLGSTLACTECHDHKYDPFTQREFYQLYAYFNNVPEKGLDGNQSNPVPSMQVPQESQTAQIAALEAQKAELEQRTAAEVTKYRGIDVPNQAAPLAGEPREFNWVEDDIPAGSTLAGAGADKSWQFVASPHPVLSGNRASHLKADALGQHVFTDAKEPLLIGEGDVLVAHAWIDPANPPQEIMLQFNDGTGWEHRAYWGNNAIDWGKADSPSRHAMGPLPPAGRWVRLEVPAAAVGLAAGSTIDGLACTQFGGHVYWDKLGIRTRMPQGPAINDNQGNWELAERGRTNSKLPADVLAALKVASEQRSEAQRQLVRDYFVCHYYSQARGTFAPLEQQVADLRKQQDEIRKQFPATMVMEEMEKPRETFVLVRGDFRTFGDPVKPGVPAALAPPPAGAPANRLGLAQWLVDPQNPLVARVTVNRYWQQYFGVGLVKTSEDFGSQGELPSHPQLLDWLAGRFIDSGWDVKGLQKMIVMSAAYRQQSRIAPEKLAKDPHNRLLAHGARFRLDAEMIRDNALSVSGLLDDRIGGPSVAPYQPPGLWEQVGFGGEFTSQSYKQSHGRDLYRRGIYVYLKRAMPYPPLVTFDAPNREVCTDSRARTNTPLQALVLLNDPAYVEAARVMAQRIVASGGSTPVERVAYAFKLCTSRMPRPEESQVLLDIYEKQLARFKQDPEAAKKLTTVGETPAPAEMDLSELAAWTAIGNVLLNLDETITKG